MDAPASGTAADIRSFVTRNRWFDGPVNITFLASGEYNENYLLESGGERFVFRVNHGTQLGLKDQIGYEYRVLQAVHPSGVTPRPIRLCGHDSAFPRGALLMEYLPGGPLEYRRDFREAARLFAKIHHLPPNDSLIRQRHPVAEIVEESRELLSRHAPHPLESTGDFIRGYARTVEELGTQSDPVLAAEDQCIVNTEVNSGNFIAPPAHEPERGLKLVDWEKAVVSARYQDLGHFLVPTTTMWKTDFRFTSEDRRAFLHEYHAAANPGVSVDELSRRTGIMERAIVLRALSWCYMAYYEYTATDRNLRSSDTFERIRLYLDNAESFMDLP